MQFDDLTLPQRGGRNRGRPLPLVRRPPEKPDALAMAAPRQPSFLGRLRRLTASLKRLARALRHERELQRGIKQLRRLDDHALRDIGIEDRDRIEALVRGARR